jgi:hypothetical protein
MLHVLDGTAGGAAAVRAEHRRAVVTLTIGDGYRDPWEKLCRTSWLSYGARHGYDIIQITGKLDTSPFAEARSPAWQKCLILQQPWAAQYQRIVFMDCDIVITGRALDITESVPDPARIGAFASGSQMSGAARQIYLERTSGTVVDPFDADPAWQRHISFQFRCAGIETDQAPMLNTGVLVLSPSHHAPLLREVYTQPSVECRLYEQPALSYAIWQRGLQAPLNARYNWSMHEARTLRFLPEPGVLISQREQREVLVFIHDEMDKAYFLHFCGYMGVLTVLSQRDTPPW